MQQHPSIVKLRRKFIGQMGTLRQTPFSGTGTHCALITPQILIFFAAAATRIVKNITKTDFIAKKVDQMNEL